MTDAQIREQISKINARHYNWETNTKANDYAHDLWSTTLQCIPDKDKTDEKAIVQQTFDILLDTGTLAKCLTDNFRKLIIRHHARGLATVQAVNFILSDDEMQNITPFYHFRHANVCGYENIKSFLIQRVSYLTPTDARWPHKKYGEYWKKERQEYIDTITEIPFTNRKEQLARLSKHYLQLEEEFVRAMDAKDMERIHKCKLQTIAAINVLTYNTSMPIKRNIFPKPQPDSNATE